MSPSRFIIAESRAIPFTSSRITLSAFDHPDMSQAIDTPAGGATSGGGGSSKRAPRGAACLNCRRRKMRCDGVRPVCGQCIRTSREIDCEYTDGPGPSPTQQLEEQIARLESRIRELEHPELVAPSVTLNPTTGGVMRTHSPAGTIGSAGRSLLGRMVTPDVVAAAMPAGGAPMLSHDPSVEPPQDLVRNLVNSFLSHSASLNFFLHVPRFMQAMQQPNVETRRVQLSPALLNAVCLWGAHLSTTNALRVFEPIFQARTTNALSSALRDSPYNVINLIQAEVLLANYFFTMSRFLEGRYHCSAAVALTLSCRLHKMRSSMDQGFGRGGARHHEQLREYNLPPPRDAIEEGERMRSFWFVYAMDKSWAVAMGSPSHFNGVAQSGPDTPWPLEMTQYEAGGYPADYRCALTVYNFLRGGPAPPVVTRDSQLASHAKASILFERATALASEWSSNETNRNEFYGRFLGLDSLIDRFIATLPPIDRSGNPDIALTSLVTHTLARAATIQLRSSFKDYDRMNDGKDLVAAQAAALVLERALPSMTSRHVDPILAILWTAVCRVFIASTTGSGSHASAVSPQQQQQHRAMLERVMAAMNRFRETSPLMGMLHDGFVSVQGVM
ncbi:hypothetical protein C2E23DRAFT_490406 [Lenzites betulinus]|nr:hypothetical protein C2E23DRAFT_490406 [Lenzites betulinus]